MFQNLKKSNEKICIDKIDNKEKNCNNSICCSSACSSQSCLLASSLTVSSTSSSSTQLITNCFSKSLPQCNKLLKNAKTVRNSNSSISSPEIINKAIQLNDLSYNKKSKLFTKSKNISDDTDISDQEEINHEAKCYSKHNFNNKNLLHLSQLNHRQTNYKNVSSTLNLLKANRKKLEKINSFSYSSQNSLSESFLQNSSNNYVNTKFSLLPLNRRFIMHKFKYGLKIK